MGILWERKSIVFEVGHQFLERWLLHTVPPFHLTFLRRHFVCPTAMLILIGTLWNIIFPFMFAHCCCWPNRLDISIWHSWLWDSSYVTLLFSCPILSNGICWYTSSENPQDCMSEAHCVVQLRIFSISAVLRPFPLGSLVSPARLLLMSTWNIGRGMKKMLTD